MSLWLPTGSLIFFFRHHRSRRHSPTQSLLCPGLVTGPSYRFPNMHWGWGTAVENDQGDSTWGPPTSCYTSSAPGVEWWTWGSPWLPFTELLSLSVCLCLSLVLLYVSVFCQVYTYIYKHVHTHVCSILDLHVLIIHYIMLFRLKIKQNCVWTYLFVYICVYIRVCKYTHT